MKKIILFILAIAIVLFGLWLFNGGKVEAPTEELGEAGNVSLEGTVVSIDLEQATFDGPYIINIEESNGNGAVISVPSMGIDFCKAKNAIISPYELKTGDVVEVAGIITSDGEIVPCDSAEHYLRLK